MYRRTEHLVVVAVLSGLVSIVGAEPLFPAGKYQALDEQMMRHGRQFYEFNARPFGLSLDAHPKDVESRGLIEQFLGQDASDDVESVTGSHPFSLLSSYGEYGDLGFFGGAGLVATAYEYMTLKKYGALKADLTRARERVVRAAESWHVFKVVSGGGGLVARGIRRLVPEDPDDPPIPNVQIELTPLFDGDGEPLPKPKDNGTYREDNSGGVLPEGTWSWKDSCSKDQLVGQVLAMASLYDAMKDDPDIDQSLVTQLQEDARLIGVMLMQKHEISQMEGPVGEGLYDLIIMDADGRPTFHHDLNPLSLSKFYVPSEQGAYNLFNLIMAWGVIKGLHHVSGDMEIEAFLYEELLGQRDFMGRLNQESDAEALDYIYFGINTNFDNPDMTAVALWLALYHEDDPEVSTVLRRFLDNGWWDRDGETHAARLCKQAFWHAIYLSLTDSGAESALVDELGDILMGYTLGPYWNTRRDNCDEDELAAGECLAVDGETVLTIEGKNQNGDWMATEALHPSIRPPSNFDARSNPFEVNGGQFGEVVRLNPGPDLLAAYWIARYQDANEPDEVNVSPLTRGHMPVGGWPETPEDAGGHSDEGGKTDKGADVESGGGDEGLAPDNGDGATMQGGGGCLSGRSSVQWPAFVLLLVVVPGLTRRSRSHGEKI